MLIKIKNSYKNKQHIIDADGVSLFLTTKAKSKHSISFTFHIECDGKTLRNIHHRVVVSDCAQDDWMYLIEERMPSTKPYKPKRSASTTKEKKYKEVECALFNKESRIFE